MLTGSPWLNRLAITLVAATLALGAEPIGLALSYVAGVYVLLMWACPEARP